MHFNETKGTGVKSNVAAMFSRIFIVDLSQDWILQKTTQSLKIEWNYFTSYLLYEWEWFLVGVKCPTLHSNAEVSKNLLE